MESVYSNWKSLRNGVIVSVVVLYLVEPAMKLAIDVVPAFGGRFYQMVWDRAARQAALGGDYLDFTLLAVMFSVLVGAVMGRLGSDGAFASLFRRKGRRSSSTAGRWDRRLVMGLFLLLAPAAATMLLIDFAAQQMKLSFHQRLTVLAPLISEEDEESLKARFADLRDRADYQGLNGELDRLARATAADLPRPLL
jgi:hypothetical protein